jgi:hypothetical protein
MTSSQVTRHSVDDSSADNRRFDYRSCGSQICSGMSRFLGCVGAWFDITVSKNVRNQSTLFTSHGSNSLASFEEVS